MLSDQIHQRAFSSVMKCVVVGWGLRSTQGDGLPWSSVMPRWGMSPQYIGNVTSYTQKGEMRSGRWSKNQNQNQLGFVIDSSQHFDTKPIIDVAKKADAVFGHCQNEFVRRIVVLSSFKLNNLFSYYASTVLSSFALITLFTVMVVGPYFSEDQISALALASWYWLNTVGLRSD